jgi:hypothetical protein
VQARGPLKTGRARVTPMHGFTGLDARFHGLFGLTFLLRPLFKAVLLVSAAMTGLVLLLLALRVFDRVLRWIRGGAGAGAAARPHGRFPRVDTLLGWLTAVAFAALAATGLGGATLRGAALHGFWMLVHVAASAAFAIGLTGLAVLRGEEETFGTPTGLRRLAALRKTWFWVWAGCGWVLMLTIATAMLRLLGTPMQETAILVHRCAAWMAIPAGILYFGLAGVRRP